MRSYILVLCLLFPSLCFTESHQSKMEAIILKEEKESSITPKTPTRTRSKKKPVIKEVAPEELLEPLPPVEPTEGHLINFTKVPMGELVKFISKLAEVTFIGDDSLLDYEVSFISGQASQPKEILRILLRMLDQRGLCVEQLGNYYLIREKRETDPISVAEPIVASPRVHQEGKFFVYKLQYHQGSEIVTALKQISTDMNPALPDREVDMHATIASMQWIQSTNSLFFSGPQKSIQRVCDLIKSLDTPLKQVFIEVLVIETNIGNSLDFGLQWSANSKYKDRVGFGAGSLSQPSHSPPFSETMASIDNASDGFKPLLMGNGFDLGIIGDMIFHKGKSFLSLGALVSALQTEGHCTIVLNQKIITQENKSSRIFVGDNVPFAGAVVQTIGTGQQTTANIEYRDVGVSLNITPLLGDSDIITLDITEEITEAIDHHVHKTNQLSGIKTSKTNMATSVHVPNGHFLILSGMTRNVKAQETTGLPCLGGLPFIGSLFSKKEDKNEKSNILIFVKPHIVTSSDDYIALSNSLDHLTD